MTTFFVLAYARTMLRRPEDDTLALVRKLHSFTNDNFSSSSSSISLSPSSSPPPLQDTSAASSLRWSQSSTSTSSVSPSFDDSAPIEFGQLALSAIEADATTAASPAPSNDAFARELSTLGLEDAAVTGLLDVYRRVVRSAEDTTAEAYEEATTISRQALARLQAAVTPDEFDEHFAQSVPQLLPAAYERAHREHLSALNDVALAAVRARCLQKPQGVKVPRPGLAPVSVDVSLLCLSVSIYISLYICLPIFLCLLSVSFTLSPPHPLPSASACARRRLSPCVHVLPLLHPPSSTLITLIFLHFPLTLTAYSSVLASLGLYFRFTPRSCLVYLR